MQLLLVDRLAQGTRLHSVCQVVAHPKQQRVQLEAFPLYQASEGLTLERTQRSVYSLSDRMPGSGQVDARDALVGRIGVALDKARLFHTLDHLGDRGGRHAEAIGQVAVRDPFTLIPFRLNAP